MNITFIENTVDRYGVWLECDNSTTILNGFMRVLTSSVWENCGRSGEDHMYIVGSIAISINASGNPVVHSMRNVVGSVSEWAGRVLSTTRAKV